MSEMRTTTNAPPDLHRIEEKTVIDEVTAAGSKLVGHSDLNGASARGDQLAIASRRFNRKNRVGIGAPQRYVIDPCI
jgi:predicted methyltransferase